MCVVTWNYERLLWLCWYISSKNVKTPPPKKKNDVVFFLITLLLFHVIRIKLWTEGVAFDMTSNNNMTILVKTNKNFYPPNLYVSNKPLHGVPLTVFACSQFIEKDLLGIYISNIKHFMMTRAWSLISLFSFLKKEGFSSLKNVQTHSFVK